MCPYNDLATASTVVSWNLSRNVAVNWHINSNGFYFIIAITHLPDLWYFLVHKFCLCFLNNYLSSITWKPWTIYAGSKKTWTLWYLLSFFFINESAFQNDLFLYLHFKSISNFNRACFSFSNFSSIARLLVFVKYPPTASHWSMFLPMSNKLPMVISGKKRYFKSPKVYHTMEELYWKWFWYVLWIYCKFLRKIW